MNIQTKPRLFSLELNNDSLASIGYPLGSTVTCEEAFLSNPEHHIDQMVYLQYEEYFMLRRIEKRGLMYALVVPALPNFTTLRSTTSLGSTSMS